MRNRGLQSPGLPSAQERWLTLLGWLSLAAIIFFCYRHDLLARIIAANGIFIIFIVLGAAVLGVLAIYGVMNSWRLLRRESSPDSSGYIDLGWGGWLMGHYTDADEDDLCGIYGGDD